LGNTEETPPPLALDTRTVLKVKDEEGSRIASATERMSEVSFFKRSTFIRSASEEKDLKLPAPVCRQAGTVRGLRATLRSRLSSQALNLLLHPFQNSGSYGMVFFNRGSRVFSPLKFCKISL